MRLRRLLVAALCCGLLGSCAEDKSLEGVDIGFAHVATISVGLDMAFRRGDEAAYIATLTGQVVALRDGVVSPSPVAQFAVETGEHGEQGLLSLTFSPDGTHAYVLYNAVGTGDVVIAEVPVDAAGTFGAQRTLITIEHREYFNHNGGRLLFGPDGMLYAGIGDGGGDGDPRRTGQDLSTLLGKLLRIDPTPSAGLPYTIPADNPFVGVDGARPEIWAYGLRNPWRFSFDRSTGDLWIGDVGQNSLEEVDVARAGEGGGRGANFGWSAYEGPAAFNTDQTAPGAVPPIYSYPHGDAAFTVVIGGTVYRGKEIPDLVGTYLFGDNASGVVWLLRVRDDGSVEVTEAGKVVGLASFAEAPDGELYALSITTGEVWRVIAA